MDRAIQEAVQILSGTHLSEKVHAVNAEVISIDLPNRTCSVQIVSGKVSNTVTAKLMSSVDDGILIVPTIGSTVTIITSDFNLPFVVQYSGIDQIILLGGDFGGLIQIVNLTLKLNSLVNQLQAELTKITVGITGAGGSYTPGSLTQFNKSDYENVNINHG